VERQATRGLTYPSNATIADESGYLLPIPDHFHNHSTILFHFANRLVLSLGNYNENNTL